MIVYRRAFWYWRRLKRRMRRAAVLLIRVGLVAAVLPFAFSLLTSIWPEAADEARRFFAVVENTVRPVRERVADELGMNRRRPAIRFADGEEPVTTPVPSEDGPVQTRPDRYVETRGRPERSGPRGDGAGTAMSKTPESVTVFRGDKVEVIPRPVRDGSRVRVLRGSHGGSHGISGRARAVDGDTLEMNGMRIRLHGIDAPEHDQSCRVAGRRWPCGRHATQMLASQVNHTPVVCEVRDRDSYGRVVATCSIAGRDLNAWMVAGGWAFAYRRYSRAYVDEEARARAARRGVWLGEVVRPWRWRARQRR